VRRFRLLSPLLVAVLVWSGPARAQETAAADVVTAPVELDGALLFRVRGVSSFPADVRARVIADRLAAVAADPAVAIEAVRAVESDGMTRIVAGAVVIMSIVDADAGLEQVERSELAATHVLRLRQAIADYRAARSPAALRRAAVNAGAATVALALAVAALFWISRRIDGLLARHIRTRMESAHIPSFGPMQPERIWSAFRRGLVAIRTLVLLAVGLAYVGFVLAQIPWTRGVSQNMTAFALGPLRVMGRAIVTNIPGLVFLTVLFFVVRLTLRLIRLFFHAIGRGVITLESFEKEWAEPTYNIVRILVVALSLIVAYPYIPGSGTAAFQGVSLFIGVVFSLGSSAAISNIIAGYMLTYRRALRVGDRVKIGDSMGDVIETRLQATHLRSFKNEEVVIPNSQIVVGEVLNYSSLARSTGLILHTEVGIGYETPWRQVEAMLLTAAARTEGFSTEPPPFVLVKRLGDFAVVYELNAYCMDVKAMARLYTHMHRHILDVFNEYGVQIMTPSYESDPGELKIVPHENWYAAPAEDPRRIR
jgi:small-conductance mechanosensitive channel